MSSGNHTVFESKIIKEGKSKHEAKYEGKIETSNSPEKVELGYSNEVNWIAETVRGQKILAFTVCCGKIKQNRQLRIQYYQYRGLFEYRAFCRTILETIFQTLRFT